MKNTEKFSGHAKIYDKFRPNYPIEMYDYLEQNFKLNSKSTIADIGAGTGIVTEELTKRFNTVYAVEPNSDMRNVLKGRFDGDSHVEIINAAAENTPLKSHSVDFIIVAQAFHWFDREKFKKECARILKPNGQTMLVWNSRDTKNKMIQNLEVVCQNYCPTFKGFSGGMNFSEESIPEDIKEFFAPKEAKVKQFSNDLIQGKDEFIGRQLSSSYAPLKGQENYNGFIKELSNIFETNQIENKIIMPQYTSCYMAAE